MFRSFRSKVMLVLVVSLFFVSSLSNFLNFKYALDSQFAQLRNKLKTIAQTAALVIDSQKLLEVPLNREGINSPAYKVVVEKLIEIKRANPEIKYIYTMARTDKEGFLQFVVDPDAILKESKKRPVDPFPGEKYFAGRFPEMLEAFDTPAADDKIEYDEWGATLSGYAPIRDQEGKAIAILGIDMTADEVALMQKGLFQRGTLILLFGVIFSLGLGISISNSIAYPIRKLVEGTRHIAKGNFAHKVEIKRKDELGELADSFNNMAASLSESREKLHDYFYRVVQAMVRSLEAKDSYTAGHSDRVSEYAERIALEMGFDAEKAEALKKAAQLHDIGKLGIHEDILNKKGSLSEDEWDIVHKHPAIGEEILKPVFLDQELLSVIRSHHERYDGSGYPDRLKGENINIMAQIVSVADAYDAMTSSRAYRPALGKSEAVKRLTEESGKQFNPKIVEAFVKILG